MHCWVIQCTVTIKNCTVLLSIKLTILLFSVSLFYLFTAFYVFSGLPWWLSGKEATCNAGDVGSIPGLGRYPEEGNGNPLRILAWKIPWTEEPGGLQSMGLQSRAWLRDWITRTLQVSFVLISVFDSIPNTGLLNDYRSLKDESASSIFHSNGWSRHD